MGVFEDFNKLRGDTQAKNVAAWTPVVAEILHGFVHFDKTAVRLSVALARIQPTYSCPPVQRLPPCHIPSSVRFARPRDGSRCARRIARLLPQGRTVPRHHRPIASATFALSSLAVVPTHLLFLLPLPTYTTVTLYSLFNPLAGTLALPPRRICCIMVSFFSSSQHMDGNGSKISDIS